MEFCRFSIRAFSGRCRSIGSRCPWNRHPSRTAAGLRRARPPETWRRYQPEWTCRAVHRCRAGTDCLPTGFRRSRVPLRRTRPMPARPSPDYHCPPARRRGYRHLPRCHLRLRHLRRLRPWLSRAGAPVPRATLRTQSEVSLIASILMWSASVLPFAKSTGQCPANWSVFPAHGARCFDAMSLEPLRSG